MCAALALDPSLPRDAVADAGRRRLLTHGVEGLRSQLNASVLARDSSVSRDTAYRVFRDDWSVAGVTDAIVAAVADATNEWSRVGYDAALGEAVAAYQATVRAGGDTADALIATLEAVFEAQFRSPGNPAGWALVGPALTASPAWKGDPPLQAGVEVAEAILQARREHYDTVTDQLVALARVAMSELGRRPQAGVDLRSVVVMTHALLDGAIVRRFIDPEAVPARLFAETLFRMWVAFSEPGSYDDPRKPDDDRSRELFDRLLDGAAELWRTGADVTVDAAAEQASVPPEAARLLFPGLGDLADSLVRARVVGGGFADLENLEPSEGADERQHLVVLETQLRRLRELADALPGAVAAAWAHPPTR